LEFDSFTRWLDITIAVVQVHFLLNDTKESIASVELIVVPMDENDSFGMLTIFEHLKIFKVFFQPKMCNSMYIYKLGEKRQTTLICIGFQHGHVRTTSFQKLVR